MKGRLPFSLFSPRAVSSFAPRVSRSRAFFDYLPEPHGVLAHLHVVEEDVSERASRQHRAQLLELARLVLVAPALAPVEPVVATTGRRRALAERIDRVPQIEF